MLINNVLCSLCMFSIVDFASWLNNVDYYLRVPEVKKEEKVEQVQENISLESSDEIQVEEDQTNKFHKMFRPTRVEREIYIDD